MTDQFFELVDDKHVPGRWFLQGPYTASGRPLDPALFTSAKRQAVKGPLHVPFRLEGAPMDFTFADYGMPVVRSALAARLRALEPEAIQLIPCVPDGQQGGFDILNPLLALDSIDEEHSDITRWRPEDGVPERVGQYLAITKLKIKTSSTAGHHVFRLKGWEVALIVSDAARQCLGGARGAVFLPV